MLSGSLIRRIRIRNYRSIADSDVCLGQLTMVVGRNGAGKSNFLDALRFVKEGLDTTLDLAIKSRGGIDAVRRRSTGHPHHIELALEILIPEGLAQYAFEIGAQQKGGFQVKSESLRIVGNNGDLLHHFNVREGQLQESRLSGVELRTLFDEGSAKPHSTGGMWPVPSSDRLYLVVASGLSPFRSTYDALTSMGFYSMNPDVIRSVQSPDAGDLLKRDGSNLASVIARLTEDRPQVKERIRDFLQRIVPEISDFSRVALGHMETLEFRQAVKGSRTPWKFHAASMSDGTLRTLGNLVAAMQLIDRSNVVGLVGLEEPETALHPAAAGILVDALREAAASTQIIVTTHSPDLLDRFDDSTDDLLVAHSVQGTTTIGPADPASLAAIKDHLFSPGDLLRMDQLQPAGSEHFQPELFSVESRE